MAELIHLLTVLASGMNIHSPPGSSVERQQKLPGVMHTGEFAQNCSQFLRALFGLSAAPEVRGDRG